MARIRYIKPDFFEDTDMAEVSVAARLLYVGLWCYMDRQGLAEDDPKKIKRNLFPYDDSVTVKKISGMINELSQAGFIHRFEYSGIKFLYCPTLVKHQKFHREERAKYDIPNEILKACCQQGASTPQAPSEHAANSAGNGERVTGNGELGTGTESHETFGAGCSSCSPLPSLSDSLTDWILEKVPIEVQRAWILTYVDVDWIKYELKKVNTYLINNPQKKPKSRWGNWVSKTWLERDWERHRKTLPSNGSNPADEWLQKKLSEEVPAS